MAILAGLLAGCAGAIHALDAAKDRADRGDWAALAAEPVPACDGRDPICAQRQALRARACALQAGAANLSEAARRPFLDCAVESGRAAIAASEAPPRPWREAYALALFTRRQARPGAEACRDNAPLLSEADGLRASGTDRLPRFLAASARLAAVTRCGATPACPYLSEAGALLNDPPSGAAVQWQALAAGIAATARRLSCGPGPVENAGG
ncbi:hypothetical protein [Falsiroseomonas sp. HW251]|uniref:hypothetical protein n=1 Tax=Falsiroseomonas sp. HW251 TaxID=3390998 RepID=UPI003D3116C5